MNDLMIDLETLGTRPGSIIASIGAVEFDAETGTIGRLFYANVNLDSAEKAGLTMDVSTVKWWMKQTDEARESTFTEGDKPINLALLELSQLAEGVTPLRIWAHSPSFDLVLLEAAYRIVDLPFPFPFPRARDTRTIFDLAGVKPENLGVAHNALDDAIAQASAVIDAYRALGKSITQEEEN